MKQINSVNLILKLKAYKYLSLYEKKRLGFVTIIPTCNRPEAIENILIIAAGRYRRLCADIIIYDSSTSDDTQKVVERFYNNGFYNVKYKRPGKYPGPNIIQLILVLSQII